jgi:ATP synthase protein I
VTERGGRQDNNRDAQKLGQADRQKTGRQEENHERDDAGLRARLDKLSSALDAQREADISSEAAKQRQDGSAARSTAKAMSVAIRILSEFIAAIIVGAAIGWGIDRAAGTTPAFLIVFLLLGAGAGFWNVYRIAMKPADLEG